MARVTSTLLALALAPALAGAQPGDPRLERLGDESFETRQQSEMQLSESEGSAIDDLFALLRDGSLDAETHRRVARIAFRRFAETPRAGMGVSFDQNREHEAGVPIREPVQNFPAFELIEPGDVILTADGIELRDSEHFGSIIVSHDPGDILEVTLVRAGERMTIDVPLGSYAALGQRARVEPARLESAFAVRCERAGVSGRAVRGSLGGGLTIDDWASAELGVADGIDPDATTLRRPRSSPGAFVRGGRPRTHDSVTAPRDIRSGGAITSTIVTNRNAAVLARRLSELARDRVILRVRLDEGDERGSAREKLELKLEELDDQIEQILLQLGG